MKNLLCCLIALLCFAWQINAQYGLEQETVIIHDGTIAEIPDGYVTYRLYVTMENEDDYLNALAGIPGDPGSETIISSTGGFWNAPIGNSALGSDISFALLNVAQFENLTYDTWVTIGAENDLIPSTVAFSPDFDVSGFNEGDDFVLNGASAGGSGALVYNLPGDQLGLPDGELRVLIGQFTMPESAELSASVTAQIFVNGNQDE